MGNADAALLAPLCWEALWCRKIISRIPTAHVGTGLCQTAAGGTESSPLGEWLPALVGTDQKMSHSYWGWVQEMKLKTQSCRSLQKTKVMCMQVVCVYQIINKHPINVTEYRCSFSRLSECLTAVLTKLYYCSSCVEVRGCCVVYIYRMDNSIFSLL